MEEIAGPRFRGPTRPLTEPQDGVVFIGRVYTPWRSREDCPRNVVEARERGGHSLIDLDPPYRAGLFGLERYSHLVLLYWMHEAERDVMIQYPRHTDGPRGVFSIRSPARPNPIAMAVAGILSIDIDAGRVEIEQVDCLTGTPLLDIKPYFPSIDAVPDAETGRTG
jgi:putative methyltransferase, YaeB/AF_0241 family